MSYYPPKFFSHFMSKISFAVIAHNTEQHCGLVLRYPSRNRILPRRLIYPQFGNHWFKVSSKRFKLSYIITS